MSPARDGVLLSPGNKKGTESRALGTCPHKQKKGYAYQKVKTKPPRTEISGAYGGIRSSFLSLARIIQPLHLTLKKEFI